MIGNSDFAFGGEFRNLRIGAVSLVRSEIRPEPSEIQKYAVEIRRNTPKYSLQFNFCEVYLGFRGSDRGVPKKESVQNLILEMMGTSNPVHGVSEMLKIIKNVGETQKQ